MRSAKPNEPQISVAHSSRWRVLHEKSHFIQQQHPQQGFPRIFRGRAFYFEGTKKEKWSEWLAICEMNKYHYGRGRGYAFMHANRLPPAKRGAGGESGKKLLSNTKLKINPTWEFLNQKKKYPEYYHYYYTLSLSLYVWLSWNGKKAHGFVVVVVVPSAKRKTQDMVNWK